MGFNANEYKLLLEFFCADHYSGLYIINTIINIHHEFSYYYQKFVHKRIGEKKSIIRIKFEYFPFYQIKKAYYHW